MLTKKEKTIIDVLLFIHFVMIIDFMIIMPMATELGIKELILDTSAADKFWKNLAP